MVKISMQFFGGRGGTSRISNVKSGGSPADLQSKIDDVSRKMEEYANYNAERNESDRTEKQTKYYAYKKQYNDLKEKQNEAYDKEAATRRTEQAKNATPHKFVNGYGEATKRDITSLTYKRAQARLRKEVEKWLK